MERTVEEAIVRAKTVYEQVTGQPPPEASLEAPYARIPPEVDREEHVLRQAASLFEKVREIQLSSLPLEAGRAGIRDARGSAWSHLPALPAPVSVVRAEDEVHYFVELAGVPKDHVSVELRGGTLRIQGDRQASAAQRSERFERAIPLPMPVEPTAVSASFADGLLTVRVRMIALSDKVHKIEVR
jgi:HSP20 family molecular chaperone IbpA